MCNTLQPADGIGSAIDSFLGAASGQGDAKQQVVEGFKVKLSSKERRFSFIVL